MPVATSVCCPFRQAQTLHNRHMLHPDEAHPSTRRAKQQRRKGTTASETPAIMVYFTPTNAMLPVRANRCRTHPSPPGPLLDRPESRPEGPVVGHQRQDELRHSHSVQAADPRVVQVAEVFLRKQNARRRKGSIVALQLRIVDGVLGPRTKYAAAA